jgi:hypothetical protein
MVCHPSGWAIRGRLTSCVLLWAVPFFLLIPLVRLGRLGIALGAAIVSVATWWSIRIFISWYFTTLVVTDRRTIRYRQHGLFDRSVAEVPYRALQDISYHRRGMSATMADYGTVVIQSASSTQRLEAPAIRHPQRVVDAIRQAQATWTSVAHGDSTYDTHRQEP